MTVSALCMVVYKRTAASVSVLNALTRIPPEPSVLFLSIVKETSLTALSRSPTLIWNFMYWFSVRSPRRDHSRLRVRLPAVPAAGSAPPDWSLHYVALWSTSGRHQRHTGPCPADRCP